MGMGWFLEYVQCLNGHVPNQLTKCMPVCVLIPFAALLPACKLEVGVANALP